MGRVQPGMEDDGPVADACGMPSFIGRFEEEEEEEKGRARLSRSLETSFADGKVEWRVADKHRDVGRSDSRLSLDGGGGRSGGGDEGGKDAGGNNNNNCNGRGERRRRASAVEILRRNFGVVKSPSLRFTAGRRMQDNNQSSVNNDGHGGDCGDGKKSDVETGDAGIRNEPTPSELTASDAHAEQRHRTCDSDCNTVRVEASHGVKQHVYCTVYCIANDVLRTESAHRRDDEADAPDPADSGSETEAGSSPEPPLYTLDDLVDPFGDISNQLYKDQDDAGSAVRGCRVCLEDKTIEPLLCCRMAVCDECLKLYVSSQVRVAKPHISCPIPECSGYLKESVVVSHLANEDVAKYRYFLELNQLDSSTKPCPQCSDFTSLKKHNNNQSEHKYKIQCGNCQFVWCFRCHAPWHNGLKCRDYRRGDKLLRTWASVVEHGQRNAQKCPQCRIHIQRTEGCDHMTCTQCNTNFCYRCGERYRHLRFFGDHTSNLSVFGCKYRYLPDKPHLRRFIRGSVCGTKVLIAPVVIVLVVVLGALALVIGLVAFPVYYVCKRKKQRTQGSGRWI
ncbi:probable E3 ubiquitin-protein ligase RNF217 [Pleuronectes platessa]|uniref:probable E3 ubiquitin-protein ligase RNF217 n=1 Tax=Pleuronectes platessa TaxID=8262 RepID=UPI00232A3E4C|nr:probable E3 ubiquitin-protein ligase RNF217 [Pleuronectes platessa]